MTSTPLMFKKARSNTEVALYQRKARWRRKRRSEVRDVAKALLDGADPRCCFKYVDTDDVKAAFRAWNDWALWLQRTHRLPDRDALVRLHGK